MNPKVILIVIAVLACSAPAALSQTPEVLTLDQAINIALRDNRTTQNARFEVEKAQDKLGATRTQMLPSFKLSTLVSQPLSTFDTTFERGIFGTLPTVGPIPSEETVITSDSKPTALILGQISQPLSQLHRIKLQIRQQEAAGQITQAQLSARQQKLVNDVKRAYYSILETQGAAEAAEATIKLYRELDRVTGEYVVQQVVLKTEHMDVQTRLAKAEYEVLALKNLLATKKEQLNNLLGRDVRTEFAVSEGLETVQFMMREPDLAQASDRALAQRPEIREARLRVEQAKLNKRIKKSEFIPDVSLTVNYISTFSYSDFLPRSVSGVGVQMDWEVFDWGRKKRELSERDRSISQADNDLKEMQSQVLMEVNSRFRSVQESTEMLRVARLAQTAARANVQLVSYKYRLEAALLKDVLHAQTVLANSDHDYQKALVSFWTAKADFEKAIGEER